MDLHEAIRRRAMVRSFAAHPVDPGAVQEVMQAALRAPSAGNTAGTSWVVLEGADQTSVYWESTTDQAWRATSARWPGLSRAPVILLAYASAEAYVARYAEADKAGPRAASEPGPERGSEPRLAAVEPGPGPGPGLGEVTGPALGLDPAEWPVPYWMGDAAFGVMTVLLCAVDAGLGACVLGNFRGEAALANALSVPAKWSLFCAVVLGHPDGKDHPSRSLDRPKPDPDQRIHRGSW
jgi:nitroreductase